MKKMILFICFTAYFNVYADYNSSGYSFQENKGQVRDKDGEIRSEVLFTGEGDSYDIYLRSTGWSYILKSLDSVAYKSHRIDIDFVNPNSVFAFETKNQIPGYDNFPVRNNESINYVLSFGEVVYKNIFNGIDLRFYYDDGNLRYDYIVHAGAKPEHIKMKIKHSGQPELNDGYGINIPSELGGIKKEKPFSYQIENHIRKEISSKYVLNTNILSFELGNYDISKELLIDPVSLISGKLKHLKSYFQRPNSYLYQYYSYGLSYRNIQRFKDNSVLNISNYAADKNFIDEGYNSSDIFERRRSSFLPCVITKYDSANKKLWSVYHYEKHNNVIAWDANDSVIVIFAHTFNYYDTVSAGYTKKTVFASVYNHSGELLKRFELEKPEGVVDLINPYLDYDPKYNYNHQSFSNYSHFQIWENPLSYEKTIKISGNKLNFLIIGRYMEKNDSNYNASLFFQKYDLEGNLEMTKEIRNNKIIARENKIIFEESNFGFLWITSDIVMARFLDDGGFFTISKNLIDQTRYFDPGFDVYTDFYNKDGEPVLRSDKEDDWTFFVQSDGQLITKSGENDVTITLAFTFDNDKNIYSLVSIRDSAVFNSKYKNLVRKNQYLNDTLDFHPYLFKFDSTLSLKWITQLINYDSNLTVGGATKLAYPSSRDPLDFGNILAVRRENYTRWNTGSSGVFVIDSTGNIYLPVLLDSTNLDGYLKKQFGARKLTITKISPDGNIIWQDTDVMHFGFDYKKDYFLGSELLIKNADIRNGTLYLDYYCSNAHTILPRKDASKFDFDEFPPVPDLEALKIVGCEYPYDKLYDILFLKFNIDESDLVEISMDDKVFDTTCVGSLSYKKIYLTNKLHSKMNFEAPLVEGEGFIVTPATAFTIDANETKEILITFIPTENKEYNVNVTFKQNNVGNFIHKISLKGIAKATLLETDLVWDLGTILLNNTASGVFRIYNNGDVASWIQAIKDLPEPFKQITPESKSNFIKGGEYLDYTIEFTPTDAGLFEYRYKIYAGTGCPDTLEVLIKGKGVTESIVINADSLDYGYLYYCENKTDTITIENITNLPLTYNSAQIAGLNADNFTILEKPTDGTILLRGNPVNFVIEFKPLTPYGNKSAILEINTSEKTLNCSLKGEHAEIDISVNDIDMGIRNLNVLYDTVLTIRNNTRDNYTLKDILISDNRVTLATALPIEIPSMQEIEIDLELSSSILGEINTDLELILSGRCSLDLSSNLVCKFDSSKAEITGIDFGKVPYCEERIDSICILNTGNPSVQITEISFIENDGSFEFVDVVTLPIELVSGKYIAVAVRYLPQDKVKSQNFAKVRAKLMIDGSESNFDAEIIGERVIPELEYLTEIDFGKLKPGEIKNINFEILNRSEEVEISEVKTITSNFKVISFSEKIIKNEKGLFNLTFSSEIIGEYSDEMIVYFSLGDCEDSIKIALKSDVSRLMTIWANHHTSEIGKKGYEIPIYAETDIGAQIRGKKYKLNLRYLPELYYNVSSPDAQILSKNRDGNYESLVIEDTFPEITSTEIILFHLKGDVLFSQRMTTPIGVEFIESEASLSVTTRDGSLTIDSLCLAPIRGIQQYSPTQMKISPNPSNGELKVSIGTQEQGSFRLVVFDVQGRELYRTEFSKSDQTFEQKDYNINTQNLGNGIYTIHLTAPWTLLREQIAVVR